MYNFNRQVFQKNIFYNNSSDVSSVSNKNIDMSDFNSFNNDSISTNYDSLNNIDSLNNFDFGDNIDAKFDDFFKTNKKRPNFDNVPLNSDSLKFNLEIFSELCNLRIENRSNISSSDLNKLRIFNKNKPFKVVELDKNIGAGLISNELYNTLIYEHLEDTEVYAKIDENPLNDGIIRYNEMILSQLGEKNISKKLFKFLCKDDFKLGNFRILPKLHKSKFSVRPIINYRNNITEKLCTLLDFLLRPYIKNADSFILDSQNLIQKTQNLVLPESAKLFSCDFESLYTNIDHNQCIDIMSEYLLDKLNTSHLNIIAFRKFLSFVLDNNYFKFELDFFKQIKGIAMGSVAGPSIANVFVMIYEIKWSQIHRPIVYLRFIDDLFVILDDQRISEIEGAVRSLKLKSLSWKNVQFLDLDISNDGLTRT